MLRQRQSTAGQDLVEYALILPLLLLLLFSIVEGGRLIFTYNTLANAAREGARRGVVYYANEAAAEDDMCEAALRLTTGVNLTCPGDIVPSRTTSTSQVIITLPFELIAAPVIEAVGGNPVITLSATSTMRRE